MFVVMMRAVAPFVAGAAAFKLTQWLFDELDHIHAHQHELEHQLQARVSALEYHAGLTIVSEAKKADVESEAKAVS